MFGYNTFRTQASVVVQSRDCAPVSEGDRVCRLTCDAGNGCGNEVGYKRAVDILPALGAYHKQKLLPARDLSV